MRLLNLFKKNDFANGFDCVKNQNLNRYEKKLGN